VKREIQASLMLGLVALNIISLPALAESDRYPTDVEMQALTGQFREKIPKLRLTRQYTDRRSVNAKQQIASFSRNWAKFDPSVGLFLGEWTALEETKFIYPSGKKGQVCIIDTYLDGKSVAAEFNLGTVANGRLRTSNRHILFVEGDFLGMAHVNRGKPYVYEYAFPKPLNHPAKERYLQARNNIIQQFNAAGCTASLPKQ
jgi:hypothetical protein